MAPSFPNEIWQHIFAFMISDGHNETAALWLEGRRVCTIWKANVEQTYCDSFLKSGRIAISFETGMTTVPPPGVIQSPVYAHLAFARIDMQRGGQYCVFCPSSTPGRLKEPGQIGEDRDVHSAYWMSGLTRYLGPRPEILTGKGRSRALLWDVSLKEVELDRLNPNAIKYFTCEDAELLGLLVDSRKNEISFDWVRMFSVYFAQAAEISRRLAAKGKFESSLYERWHGPAAADENLNVQRRKTLRSFQDKAQLAFIKEVRQERVTRHHERLLDRNYFGRLSKEEQDRARQKLVDILQDSPSMRR